MIETFKHVTGFDESEARVFCDRAITKTFAFEIFESCSLELGVLRLPVIGQRVKRAVTHATVETEACPG